MARRKSNPKAFRLSFGGTSARKWAPTLKAAVADAKYWTAFGQKRVCIDRKLPTGGFSRVKCVHRRKGAR
jgi:hypothetical protein